MGNRSNCQFELGEHASTINFKGLPSDEDLITVGTNIRITHDRCQQIMEEIKEKTEVLINAFSERTRYRKRV